MTGDTEYRLRTEASAQVLMRVINFFAQRDVLPSFVSTTTVGEELVIVVKVSGLADQATAIIAEKMRSSPMVLAVDFQSSRIAKEVEHVGRS